MTEEVKKMTRLERAARIAVGRRLGMSPAQRELVAKQTEAAIWTGACRKCGPLRGTLAQLRAHRCTEG